MTGICDYDIAIAADMTEAGEHGFRIAREASAYAAEGYSVALVHLGPAAERPVSPDVQGCVTAGIADPVDPSKSVGVDRLVVYGAHRIDPALHGLRGLKARDVTVIVDRLPRHDVAALDRRLRDISGGVQWSPVNRAIRAALESGFPGLALTAADRLPFAAAGVPVSDGHIGHRLVVGQVGGDGRWPSAMDDMVALYPTDGSLDVCFLGAPPLTLTRYPNDWQVLDPTAMPVARFLNRLDVLVHFPEDGTVPAEAIVAGMLERGKLVLMDRRLRERYGAGPVYCDLPEAAEALRKYVVDPVIRRSVRDAGLRAAQERVQRPPLKSERPHAPPARAPRQPTALFISSNGTGLGHVNTQLAIARRTRQLRPFFVSMSQAVDVIQSFGITAEYIPSHRTLDTDFDAWDAWFAAELEQIIDRTNAQVVIYDGNAPSPGLVKAVGSRGNCGLVWTRIGMTGHARPMFAENASYFDMVIEPGELARPRDPAAPPRPDRVLDVDPFLLLDPAELLPREAAAQALNLDPKRPSVLIQLGAGSNRDTIGLIDSIVTELDRFNAVQIVIAEWSTGAPLPPLWSQATYVRGFPLAQYYRAFDFTVTAAGYNTFHEVVAYGLPAIFLANTHRSMDDQAGRARFAETNELALELNEHDLAPLGDMINALLAEPARAYMRDNCRKHAFANGAAAVAGMLDRRFAPGARP